MRDHGIDPFGSLLSSPSDRLRATDHAVRFRTLGLVTGDGAIVVEAFKAGIRRLTIFALEVSGPPVNPAHILEIRFTASALFYCRH